MLVLYIWGECLNIAIFLHLFLTPDSSVLSAEKVSCIEVSGA